MTKRKRRNNPHPPRDIRDIAVSIIKDRKYLDISLETIMERLNLGVRVDEEIEHETISENGDKVNTTLRCTIVGNAKFLETWNVSLLLASTRIDGFGFERRFFDIQRTRCSGWHRHVWDPEEQNANGKISVSSWKGEMTFRDFVRKAFKEMNLYCQDDYEQPYLF